MKNARFRAAALLGQGLVGSLFTTTRLTRVGQENYLPFRREGLPIVFVFWHDQLLPLVHYHRNEDIVVLVSEHADGEYITRIIERQGFDTARGSSTRGGIKGLKALIRAGREGHDLAITPDGPRGPRHVFKPGALLAAQVIGAPIVPLAAGASASWRFESWDRFMLPRPLSRVTIEYGEPVYVDRAADEVERERLARELTETLEALTSRVEEPVEDGVYNRGAER
ncbi:MAG: lysophospholipid acyltransferase family protein [Gemmatimonadota bacterium]